MGSFFSAKLSYAAVATSLLVSTSLQGCNLQIGKTELTEKSFPLPVSNALPSAAPVETSTPTPSPSPNPTPVHSGTTYYFSNTLGKDDRTVLEAQNPSTPWKSLSKLNSFFSSLRPGDAVLLRRGDVFYGTIQAGASGSATSPIVIGAYGTGANPVVTGFSSVSGWTNLGGNIWESSTSVSSLTSANVVLINGVAAHMGRYPNSGYLNIDAVAGNSLSNKGLNSASTNWTGAEAVIRKKRWIIDRAPISAHSGTSISYVSPSSYPALVNYKFFIQNDARTLDSQNEWYYNPTTKKLRIYSSNQPANIQVSTVENLFYALYRNYLTIDSIAFTGSNGDAFYVGSSLHFVLRNSSFDFNQNGFHGWNYGASSDSLLIERTFFNHTNNDAINLPPEFTHPIIQYNTVQNFGMDEGAGASGDGSNSGILVDGPNSLIQFNTVVNSGYIGISFVGPNSTVTHNYVDRFCILKDDGGGIYTGNESSGNSIAENIVMNGIGAPDGTDSPSARQAYGIYIDGTVSSGFSVARNSIAHMGDAGIYLHNSHDVSVTENLVFDQKRGFLVVNDVSTSYLKNLTLTGNSFIGRTVSQYMMQIVTLHDDIPNIGTFDRNIYARVSNDAEEFVVTPNGYGQKEFNYSLAGWKSYSKLDAKSTASLTAIPSESVLLFETNPSNAPTTVNLRGNYVDLNGTAYKGKITLAPYRAAILIQTD
ncbi:MAG: right-handed parallel beta-helix repeat-containing protein [Bdellovibrionales bacterium]|nr:right-handed parallel beta-helix repeat-containing protein [Bdellovibrionales bacterium]